MHNLCFKSIAMKRILIVALVIIAVNATSCGNQNKQPTTNTPTAPDSAVSNGTEGTIGSDTGVGAPNTSTTNGDTSKKIQ
jgi:hypothetical protein